MRFRLVTIAIVLMAFVGFAAASDQQTASHEVLAAGGLPRDLVATPVTGEPFSAVWTTDIVKTLPDGTKITEHGHHFVARDSQGRERVEMRIAKATDQHPDIKMVMVIDPVEHTLTTWMVGAKGPKMATVAKLKDRSQSAAGAPATQASRPEHKSNRPPPEISTQDLGMQLVDDVPATGERTTTIVPVGRSGNDQPITKTHEIWTSDEMKLILLQKWTDPRMGERTTQLEHFSRAEPDPALFHPPAGYQIKTAEQTLRELSQKLEAAADAQE